MEKILSEIVQNLQIVNPVKIILFRSHARGAADELSDIDLVVILDTENVPDTYDEKLDLKIKVRDSIYELSRRIPIDLVVYTAGEFELLRNRRTSFYNELSDTGKVIYEKAG